MNFLKEVVLEVIQLLRSILIEKENREAFKSIIVYLIIALLPFIISYIIYRVFIMLKIIIEHF